jgi:hypothetical protein
MFTWLTRTGLVRWARRLHRDEGGAISLMTVFAVVLLAFLLGMVMNVGRHVDHKVVMQNAADASAEAGATTIARGMNAITFTNHLLCDIFALTAFMREARDGNALRQAPDVLRAWERAGEILAMSSFPKFRAAGQAIRQKAPLEREMVDRYGDWAAASSALMLPPLEEMLHDELIPNVQRALVVATPHMAQIATAEVAKMYGDAAAPKLAITGVLWRTLVDPVGGESEETRRTVPAVDPAEEPDGLVPYKEIAIEQRRSLAHHYLRDWNNASLRVFDREAKMSRFSELWRGFTCGHLEQLLNDEYPETNLLHVIRTPVEVMADVNATLDDEYTYVAVVYSPHIKELLPGLFRNPAEGPAMAFAQANVFIPKPRLVKGWRRIGNEPPPPPGETSIPLGGVPGDNVDLPVAGGGMPPPRRDTTDHEYEWFVTRQHRPVHWDLINQNWSVRLVPAASESVATILATVPHAAGQTPHSNGTLSGLTTADLNVLNAH